MKKDSWRCMIVMTAVLFVLTACAGKTARVTDDGFQLAEQAISIPHPSELEKIKDQYVVIFPIILDPGLWGVEGFSHNELDIGVFPVITDSEIKGYAFITEPNDFADVVMQAMVVGRKDQIGKIVHLSRGGDTVHDITGQEFSYDFEKFKEDPVYKAEILSQTGMSIQEIENFWRKYSEERGMEVPPNFQFVEEIKVGSVRWEKYKTQLATRLTQFYKMPDGQIRQGYMSLDDFRLKASKNNSTTPGQRFSRKIFVPGTVEPFTLALGTIGSMLNGLIAASNGPVEGFYAIAECQRGDLKSRFREMSDNFKRLLMERDRVIYDLFQRMEDKKS